MTKHILTLALALFSISFTVNCQVAINTDGSSPNSSAMLDVSSTDKGLLIPRLTTAQRATLATTAIAGLMVYDTDLDKFFFHNGATWESGSVGNLFTRNGSYTYLTTTTDFVGVGTTSPARKLEIDGGAAWQVVRINSLSAGALLEFKSNNATNWAIGTFGGSARLFSTVDNFANNTEQYYFTTSSFYPYANSARTLGLTTKRWSNLYSVAGDFSGDVSVSRLTAPLTIFDGTSDSAVIYINPMTTSSGQNSTIFFAEDHDATYGMCWTYDGSNNNMGLWGVATGVHYGPHVLFNRNSGEMAIGKKFASGYKLSVDGKIICEELRVNLVADWPDYVFMNGYYLMPLNELDLFIKNNGHLPNIPAADEIQDSGMEVGEMQRLMMEKIEELSLYIIQQQKEIDELKRLIHKNQEL